MNPRPPGGAKTYRVRVRRNNARTGTHSRASVVITFNGCTPEGETDAERGELIALVAEGAMGHAFRATHVTLPTGEEIAVGRQREKPE